PNASVLAQSSPRPILGGYREGQESASHRRSGDPRTMLRPRAHVFSSAARWIHEGATLQPSPSALTIARPRVLVWTSPMSTVTGRASDVVSPLVQTLPEEVFRG